jgi:thioredoxin 1
MLKTIVLTALILLIQPIALGNDAPVYVDNLINALAESQSSGKDILVIFTADWCGVCKVMKNDLVNNPSVIKNKIVCYIDYDKNKDLIKEYRVNIIPDYLIIRNSIEIKRKIKYTNLEAFKIWIKNE